MKRMLAIDVALLIAYFLAWFAADYALVRSPGYPDNIHSVDWLFILIPVVTLATNLWITRHFSRPRAILYSILGTLLVCLALVFIVMTLGILFHFSFGGQL
jgi:multisubunit Na+/H+ antiporter MnhF subunit